MLVTEEEAREPHTHPTPRFWSSQSEKGLRKSAFNHMLSKENALDSTEKKKTLKSYFCSSTKTMSNLGPLTARITTIVIFYWAHTIFQDLRDSGVFLRAGGRGGGVVVFWVGACAPSIPPSVESALPPCHVTQVELPIKRPSTTPLGRWSQRRTCDSIPANQDPPPGSLTWAKRG